MNLIKLPIEIIVKIYDELHPYNKCQLSQTCKTLNIIYHEHIPINVNLKDIQLFPQILRQIKELTIGNFYLNSNMDKFFEIHGKYLIKLESIISPHYVPQMSLKTLITDNPRNILGVKKLILTYDKYPTEKPSSITTLCKYENCLPDMSTVSSLTFDYSEYPDIDLKRIKYLTILNSGTNIIDVPNIIKLLGYRGYGVLPLSIKILEYHVDNLVDISHLVNLNELSLIVKNNISLSNKYVTEFKIEFVVVHRTGNAFNEIDLTFGEVKKIFIIDNANSGQAIEGFLKQYKSLFFLRFKTFKKTHDHLINVPDLCVKKIVSDYDFKVFLKNFAQGQIMFVKPLMNLIIFENVGSKTIDSQATTLKLISTHCNNFLIKVPDNSNLLLHLSKISNLELNLQCNYLNILMIKYIKNIDLSNYYVTRFIISECGKIDAIPNCKELIFHKTIFQPELINDNIEKLFLLDMEINGTHKLNVITLITENPQIFKKFVLSENCNRVITNNITRWLL